AYWSLVWQQLTYISISSLLKYVFTRWHPSLPIDLKPIRPMLQFSSRLLLTNILTVASNNVLTFIFGKKLTIDVVGQFNQANKWNTMGHSFISSTMAQVVQPVLTNVGDEKERQERVFRKMLRFTSFICFPLMLGLALVAHEFIVLTITDKWEPSVPLLQVLCVGGAFIPLHTLYQNFIISRGRSDLYLYCIVLQLVLQIVFTLFLAPYGLMAMVTAFSAMNVAFTVCWHFALRRIHPLSILDALKDTVPFAAVALACVTAAYWSTTWLTNLWMLLSLRIIITALLYLGSMKVLRVKTLDECVDFIRKKC
ncbi:MAG: oligosaccharide flippase family protein, partial [Prevotella sp.]|nr:oligosaccharide flippase family protein [Prevotella sp.]